MGEKAMTRAANSACCKLKPCFRHSAYQRARVEVMGSRRNKQTVNGF
jgi:hypothetical protein